MSATIIPFPVRPSLSRAERDLIARWKRATPGIAHVYVRGRRPHEPHQAQDRILVIDGGTPASGWVVCRPGRRWIVRRDVGMEQVGEFATLADALAAIRPASEAGTARPAAAQAMPSAE